MGNFIALITIILWPVIPIFWIPIHGLSKISKRLGLLAYVIPGIVWLSLAYILYTYRDLILYLKMPLPIGFNILGIILLSLGTLLHIWTGWLLGLWGLVGLPEISSKVKGRFVTEGPYSIVRHPTYLAHTLMFLGVFLLTEVISVAIITLLDFIIVNTLIIPLEERECSERFGKNYTAYREKVPSRFLPKVRTK